MQGMGKDMKLHDDVSDFKGCNPYAQNALMSGIKKARRHFKYYYYFYIELKD